MDEPVIRPLTAADWPAVRAIYEEGIAGGDATFETAAPGWADWDRGHLAGHRLVATLSGRVAGWAALSPTSARPAYAGVAEASVYVAGVASGRGVGRALPERLVEGGEAAGIWTVQAGVFPENAASLALHRRCGFRTVGVRERVGELDGRWRDVVLLERRSPRVG